MITNLDELCINTLRFLAVDAVEQAHSGHPGMPLGAAPMAYILWDRFLRHNPRNPVWFNRDRFILSAGHGSALLYALLHLYGYNLSLDELKRFRQWESKTPGHPEYGLTPGIEATTGPLGQGFAMGVGMAMVERHLAACFNRPDFPIVDHHTYAIVSDGDLMEGVSSEAASLAGTLKLGRLIYLYDDNHITIEGKTELTFTESVHKRFEAYGWHVLRVLDGNDLREIESAIQMCRTIKDQPSLIKVRTHIGYGSPKQDSETAHGAPLGFEAVRATKTGLDWPLNPSFYIPQKVLHHCRQAIQKGEKLEAEWQALLDKYSKVNPVLATRFKQVIKGKLPLDWRSDIPIFDSQIGVLATRDASGKVMNALAKKLSQFMLGGSADLAPSTKTILVGQGDFSFKKCNGHNIHFGVREHAMGAIANGMALHGLPIPYAATFLVFSDYMRPSLRMAALMQTHVIFIFTHDSIAIGEDGPTHQPVEQLMSLRTIPGLIVIRPADANETAIAWRVAVERKGPVALILTRQKLPILDIERFHIAEGLPCGAYVLSEPDSNQLDVILIATGSEVHLALAARKELKTKGVRARVVSMPSWELFEEQPAKYRHEVLPNNTPKLAIEAGSPLGWRFYVGDTGGVIGLKRFGISAKGKTVYAKLGFNVKNVVKHALALL